MQSFNKLSTAILVVAGLTAQNANAVSDIRLGHPGSGGNGCPQGTVSATLSPDKKSLSILFDQFTVKANRDNQTARKHCNLAIPVKVPNGISISVFNVDHRGFVSIPTIYDYARLSAEYFFAGKKGPIFTRYIKKIGDYEYFYKNEIEGIANVWSSCGKDVNLRVNTNMFVKSKSGKDVMGSLDSQDIRANMVFHVKQKQCGQASNPEPDPFPWGDDYDLY
jgi:hypothetical protein